MVWPSLKRSSSVTNKDMLRWKSAKCGLFRLKVDICLLSFFHSIARFCFAWYCSLVGSDTITPEFHALNKKPQIGIDRTAQRWAVFLLMMCRYKRSVSYIEEVEGDNTIRLLGEYWSYHYACSLLVLVSRVVYRLLQNPPEWDCICMVELHQRGSGQRDLSVWLPIDL